MSLLSPRENIKGWNMANIITYRRPAIHWEFSQALALDRLFLTDHIKTLGYVI